MNEQILKYAFTKDELEKYAGLLSFLGLTGLKNLVKFIVSAIKNIAVWVITAYGVTSISDIYKKFTENPEELFNDENKLWKVWRSEEGPFENIFRVATYAMPAFGGIFGGGIALILDKFLSSKYGIGFEDMGKWLDKQLKLGPGDNARLDDNSLTSAVANLFSRPEMSYDNNMKDLTKLFSV